MNADKLLSIEKKKTLISTNQQYCNSSSYQLAIIHNLHLNNKAKIKGLHFERIYLSKIYDLQVEIINGHIYSENLKRLIILVHHVLFK